ncbi:MAG: 3-dehydroquinate dehydratase [Epsilonproteobacteria bacterium]|nr:MAG: 3-dehydroquinate dehydratase [Campylobacterota bacterium]RLA65221.1 MAG: 3-dehydroquinate dehydratase [Campylobacterota bacterium]
MKKFLIINGPNLNLLGKREPEIYGDRSLSEIEDETMDKLKNFEVEVDWFQSNIEGEIISRIGESMGENLEALIINPAAYAHYSIGILDALKMVPFKVIEVHLSNTNKREDYRRAKLTAQGSDIIMEGLGQDAYFLAIYSQLI